MKLTKKALTFEFNFNSNTDEDKFDVTVQGNTTSAYTSTRKNTVKFVEELTVKIDGNQFELGGVKFTSEKIEKINNWHEQEISEYLDNADIEVIYKNRDGRTKLVDYVTVDGEIKYQRELLKHFDINEIKEIENNEENENNDDNKDNKDTNNDDEIIKEAIELNKKILIKEENAPCCDASKECDLDIIRKYATPKGKIEYERIHTH